MSEDVYRQAAQAYTGWTDGSEQPWAEERQFRRAVDAAQQYGEARALRRIDAVLAELPYHVSGGVFRAEREAMFEAVNVVARELFGEQWHTVMRNAPTD